MSELATGHLYRHLFSSGRIGSLELRNRILMCPMGDNLANEDGEPSSTSMDYFEARASGGVGLIVVGSVAVTWPEGSYNPNQSALSEDRMIAPFAELADRVHSHGAKIAAQLAHGGLSAVNDMRDGRPLWVPSIPKPVAPDPLMAMVTPEEAELQTRPMRATTTRVSLHEMTKADIDWLIERYAEAADRAKRAGLDGVEIHAGHGYVISSFLSPAKNHRRDEYGGSLANRARLLIEIIEAIRERVGHDFAVWCRIDSVEFWEEDGIQLEMAIELASLIEAAGGDAIHASANGQSGNALTYTEGHTTHAPAGLLAFAEAIGRATTIPVIAVGRIEPEVAESAIADGRVQFVAMGRKLLADPELPNKLRAQRPEDVRPCMYHYNCIGQIFLREPVRCWNNPATGREAEFAQSPSTVARRVLVVGAGPAGLEAARLASLRGHDVVLYEASDRLGGRFALAAETYEPNARMLSWLEGQVRKLDIEIRIGTRFEVADVSRQEAEAVIVATGGDWRPPEIPGADNDRVVTMDGLRKFMDGEKVLGDRVVILGGGRAGVGLADYFATRGRKVRILERTNVFASQMGLPGRWRIVHELRELGVSLEPNASVKAFEGGHIVWTDAEGVELKAAADHVFIAEGAIAEASLIDDLAGSSVAVHAIGDCDEIGFVRGAMESAARAAAKL